MSVSSAQALTRQFYEWEQCGRGWHKSEVPCHLEPPFVPFFGHYVENVIIDDGRKPTWLSELFSPSKPIERLPPKEEPIRAFPFDDPSPLCLYTIVLPRNFRQQAERMEQLLIMLSYRKSPISFEIIGTVDAIKLQWCCRLPDSGYLLTQIRAFFPDCTVLEAQTDALVAAIETELPIYTVDFGLQEEFMRPLAMQSPGDTDAYTALFGVLSQLQEDEYVVLQILFSGTHNAWSESIMTAVCDDSRKQSFFFDAPEMPQLAREKVSRPFFGVVVRLITLAPTLDEAGVLLQHASTGLVHATTGNNSLVPLVHEHYTVEERVLDFLLRQSHRVGMLLNSRELSNLAHFPSANLSKKLMGSYRATKAAPAFLVDQDYCLGLNVHNGLESAIGIDTDQRLRHIHIIGATGTGKSTLLHSLIAQDIDEGAGLCVIDPHGDLIENILDVIPEHRLQDVVLVDPTDSEFPIGLNILQAHSDLEKELLASDLVALFRRFSTSWGDQMNSVFANAISAFVYNKKTGHIGDLRKFLIEQPFRNEILTTCTDPDIVYYWQKEYPILKSSSIGSILTRLDSFLRPRLIRNMVCQPLGLNFRELMDSRKIVLVKLSQGLLGEENSYLLGAFIVSKLQQTAMARQSQAAQDRVPFFCYVDEFQNFVTPSMASILSGARKYSLGLVLAHQDMQQVARVDSDIAGSVISNAGTRICFRLGDTDAKRMQEGFSSFTAEDLQGLSTGEAIVRVNTREQDFNISVLPHDGSEAIRYRQDIIALSRERYSVPIVPAVETVEPSSQPVGPSPTVSPTEPVADEPQQKDMREHRYLQTFIKKLAEEYGYRAGIEVPTPDGKGLVDVLLEKEGKRIAIEISVSTNAEWELHNVQKCLAAGYEQIAVCTASQSKLTQIQSLVEANLSRDELSRVHVISPEGVQSLFVTEQPKKNAPTVIKGYRVKVQYEQSAGTNTNDIIQRIINTKKP
jgi:hypothetical protein